MGVKSKSRERKNRPVDAVNQSSLIPSIDSDIKLWLHFDSLHVGRAANMTREENFVCRGDQDRIPVLACQCQWLHAHTSICQYD